MKSIIKLFVLCLVVTSFSCEDLVDGINDNPNKVVPEEIDANLFLTGAILANNIGQAAHSNRISGLYSGQLVGNTSVYGGIYDYNITTLESNADWRRFYIGVVPQVRYIRERAPDDLLLVGICKVIEAHAMGTAASLFGDIPYSQINDLSIADPQFDDQSQVFNDLIALLNSAIADLGGTGGRSLSDDLYFSGDRDKWLEAAYTLTARYHLQLKEYGQAYSAASNGISSAAGTMMYTPTGDESTTNNDNLFWDILAGSRGGDIDTGNSYMMQLLTAGDANERNNAKTNESARHDYYVISEDDLTGKADRFEPHVLISYEENLLILAEAGARSQNFATGLGHLNEVRQYLNTGAFLNSNFSGGTYLYDDYVAADFDAGGIENADNIDSDRALIREIVEERYISGFGTFIPFNDARRLRKSDSDVSVPFPFNNANATAHPERLPYAQDEINANSNITEDLGIYATTSVNQ
jgi:hypothetical protein